MKPDRVRILVVDDDLRIRSIISSQLQAAGYSTLVASDGAEGAESFSSARPDLVVTDLSMPRGDGFWLIEHIRERAQTPIIVLSVHAEDDDKIRALDLGADDFVVKPFSMPELLARIRTQLRRNLERWNSRLAFPGLTIDLEKRRVIQGEKEIRLTPIELGIIELLARNAGKPVTIAQIIRSVWNDAPGTTPDTVRVHVRSLRKKIEPDPAAPTYIETEPWVGYRFIAEPVEDGH
jgi:two-component system KDP operon response regulator KdpE